MRILGWLAMAAAVMGIIGGIALAAGVWIIKPDIQARVDGLVAAADTGFERAIALTDTVASELTEVTASMEEVRSKADELIATLTIDPAVAERLSSSIDDFISGPYAALRTDYAALRERVTTVGDALRALDKAIPAITLPGTATERLQAIDAKLVEIDAAVMALGDAGVQGLSSPGVASQVSEAAATANQLLADVSEVLTDVGVRLQGTRDRLADADDRVAALLTMAAVVGTLFGLYLSGLNVLLFQRGRRWSRQVHGEAPVLATSDAPIDGP